MVAIARLLAFAAVTVSGVAALDQFRDFDDSPAPIESDVADVPFSIDLDPNLQNFFVPPNGVAQQQQDGDSVVLDPTSVDATAAEQLLHDLRREAMTSGDSEYMYFVSSSNSNAIVAGVIAAVCVVALVVHARQLGRSAKRAARDVLVTYSPARVARRNTWPLSQANIV